MMTEEELIDELERVTLAWALEEEPTGTTCIGYLDHPYKNKHLETDKVLLPLLANTDG